MFTKIYRTLKQLVTGQRTIPDRENPGIGYIFISETSRRQLLRRIAAPKNQFLVKNPINVSGRYRIHAEDNHAFLFVGRLSPEKGVTEFCRAVHAAHVQGVVIGDGDLRPKLEAQYPDITFTGWLTKDEILQQFKQARCVVLSSICYETFGLTAYEAEAYGIPVIASDLSAASEDAAFVYHSQAELEALIRQAASQDISALSAKTYENFDDTSADTYADELLKTYNTALTGA